MPINMRSVDFQQGSADIFTGISIINLWLIEGRKKKLKNYSGEEKKYKNLLSQRVR